MDTSKFSLKYKNAWPAAAAAAWLVPGLGHLLLGRPVRAIIIFICVNTLFFTGLAIGGVFTINPRVERWWQYAQMGTGAAALVANQRQNSTYARYYQLAQQDIGPFKVNKSSRIPQQRQQLIWQQQLQYKISELLANDNLALSYPASNPAVIYSSVAGLMNIMAAIDAAILCMLGVFSEPKDDDSPELG